MTSRTSQTFNSGKTKSPYTPKDGKKWQNNGKQHFHMHLHPLIDNDPIPVKVDAYSSNQQMF